MERFISNCCKGEAVIDTVIDVNGVKGEPKYTYRCLHCGKSCSVISSILPNMISVKSSNISKIGYNDKLGALLVEFSSGSVYEYNGVNKQLYEELMQSDSKGKYFSQCIRNRFKGIRV